MPTTLPGISVTKAAELLQMQDRIIRVFPEVESVYGKAGRAATATDPAPTEMFETVINLKPKDEWRAGLTRRRPDRRDGQGAAVSRRLQRLDHADQGAHRHALDRHPHAGRRQGDRHRSGRDGKAGTSRSSRCCKAVPGTSTRLCRARSSAATTSTSCPTARRLRATASWSGRAGRDRDRARRRRP